MAFVNLQPWKNQPWNTEQGKEIGPWTHEVFSTNVDWENSTVHDFLNSAPPALIVTKNRVYLFFVSIVRPDGDNSHYLVYSAPIDDNGVVGEWSYQRDETARIVNDLTSTNKDTRSFCWLTLNKFYFEGVRNPSLIDKTTGKISAFSGIPRYDDGFYWARPPIYVHNNYLHADNQRKKISCDGTFYKSVEDFQDVDRLTNGDEFPAHSSLACNIHIHIKNRTGGNDRIYSFEMRPQENFKGTPYDEHIRVVHADIDKTTGELTNSGYDRILVGQVTTNVNYGYNLDQLPCCIATANYIFLFYRTTRGIVWDGVWGEEGRFRKGYVKTSIISIAINDDATLGEVFVNKHQIEIPVKQYGAVLLDYSVGSHIPFITSSRIYVLHTAGMYTGLQGAEVITYSWADFAGGKNSYLDCTYDDEKEGCVGDTSFILPSLPINIRGTARITGGSISPAERVAAGRYVLPGPMLTVRGTARISAQVREHVAFGHYTLSVPRLTIRGAVKQSVRERVATVRYVLPGPMLTVRGAARASAQVREHVAFGRYVLSVPRLKIRGTCEQRIGDWVLRFKRPEVL